MTLHCMNGGKPFETSLFGVVGHVVAYQNGMFLFVQITGSTSWAAAEHFNPPPPIPAVAVSPKVGEVWVINGWAHLLMREVHGNFYCLESSCSKVARYRVTGIDARPATPEEAEPFRSLLDGLRAILGEKA